MQNFCKYLSMRCRCGFSVVLLYINWENLRFHLTFIALFDTSNKLQRNRTYLHFLINTAVK
jgi:hypothetical protein